MSNKKLPKWLKIERQVSRQLEIEAGIKPKHKIHKTSKKDLQDKSSNTIKDYEA